MNDISRLDAVKSFLREGLRTSLVETLSHLPPSELVHLISRLDDKLRTNLFQLLPPESGASVIESLPLALAGEVLADLEPSLAAAILDKLPSDDQTDLLTRIGEPIAAAILAQMAPAEAADVNRLAPFAEGTAGGLMATEFLSYLATSTVADVLEDLRIRADEYTHYRVQYVYVVSLEGRLLGVVRLRDLLFHRDSKLLSDLPLQAAFTVDVTADWSQLEDFFDRHSFFAAPVVDGERRLVGVVTRSDFDEAAIDQAAQTFLRFSGIVFGEEFRSMPLATRIVGRLTWLIATMLLSFLAASVVGMFQGTLSQLITLAVFLPVISGMSGNAGNQAIAVSMRELSLGLVMPQEIAWVLAKETAAGLVTGAVLGFAMTLVALVWQGNLALGVVIGAAQALSILLAVCVGGVVPLVLKRLGFDPAIASAPLLTTITDAAGFFLTLGLASLWLMK